MNTGQSLFAIGALLLLSLTILRVNNNILLTDTIMYDSKFGLIANSIATSLIESATEKYFDVNTKEGPCLQSALTYPLNKESGETNPSNFDDFDDFNNYAQADTINSVDNSLVFYSKCIVAYVNPNPSNPTSLNNIVSTRQWHKKLTVYVTWRMSDQTIGVAPPDTIKQSTIYSYWFF
jgi:hypothetical protein